jgi:putative ABC transport system ATP-binding protein
MRLEIQRGKFMTIILKDIVKTFHQNNVSFEVLKGLSLTIQKGEFVSIVGKSGSGKSTLINMITGIDYPTSGDIEVLGTTIHNLSRTKMSKWRGTHIGIIFQFFQLIPTLTLIENVILPMDLCHMYSKKERRKRALELLELVGMIDFAYKYPSEVSGGQQQRAAIARALANDPPIIVADEPTGSLDGFTASKIIDLFEELANMGKTVIIVTHDESLAETAHRKITIHDGEIVLQPVEQISGVL